MGKRIGTYELGRLLGSGAFSKVKLGTDSRDGSKWAVKIIDKEQLEREHLHEQLKREIAIMKSLKHPHIVNLREVMQTANHIYMVLEVVAGGELFDKIVESKKFDEDTGRRYFQQLVAAVQYCHKQGIAHRDIKPENLLLDENNNLKISDFGLSNLQPSNRAGLLQTVCGTPNYVAPEVLKEKGYDGFKADAWSCGVVLFVMLAGYLPFDADNQNALFNKIERGDFRMSRSFTEGAKDMISKLLVVDPSKRPTLEEVMEHSWFKVGAEDSLRAFRERAPSHIPSEDEVRGAIKDEVEVDAAAAPKPRRAPSTVGGTSSSSGSGGMDAFAMIDRLAGGVLGGQVGASTKTDLEVASKSYNFLVMMSPAEMSKAYQVAGCNVKAVNELEARGFHTGNKGIATFTTTYAPTAVEGMTFVTLKRGRGDAIDFRDFVGKLFGTLGPALRTPFADASESSG